jgi:hypothetical protein
MDSKQPEYFLIPNELLQKIVAYMVTNRPMIEVAELVNDIDKLVKPYDNQANDTKE